MLGHDQRKADQAVGSGARTSEPAAVGKTTLTQDLVGPEHEPQAEAASATGQKKKSLLDSLHHELETVKAKVLAKIGKLVVGKLAGQPQHAIDKALAQLEDKAQNAINRGLADGDKNCVNQADVDDITRAIDSTRLFSAYHMIENLDSAVEHEVSTINSKQPTAVKTLRFIVYLGAAAAAVAKYFADMAIANEQLDRLTKLAARCRPRPRVLSKAIPVPDASPHTLPHTIPLPTNEGVGPTEQIGIPEPLITGVG